MVPSRCKAGQSLDPIFPVRQINLIQLINTQGFTTSRHNKGPYASLLRQHYERLLFPYDVFLSGATIAPPDDPSSPPSPHPDVHSTAVKSEDQDLGSNDSPLKLTTATTPAEVTVVPDKQSLVRKAEADSESENSQPEKKQLRSSPRRLCRRSVAPSSTVSPTSRRSSSLLLSKSALSAIANLRSSKELRKLQVFGAGPKMPGIVVLQQEPESVVTVAGGGPRTRSASLTVGGGGGSDDDAGIRMTLSSHSPPHVSHDSEKSSSHVNHSLFLSTRVHESVCLCV